MKEGTQKKESYFHVRADKDFKAEYQNYCVSQGYTTSKRIIALLKKDFEGKLTIEK